MRKSHQDTEGTVTDFLINETWKNTIIMALKIIRFLKNDIWSVQLENLPRAKSFFIRQLRIALLTLRGFRDDKCGLKASALTFYSLLSVVPVVALAFGIAKGFSSEKHFEKQLIERFPGQEEVIGQVIGFAHSLLAETRGGMIAGIGVAVLFWIVIRLLSNIEHAFNDIWEVKKPRSIGRKLSDYISIMLICPFFLIISSSITVFIATQITHITERFSFLGVFSPLIFFLLKLLPYGVIWGVFAFMYIFMPNTKVHFISGLLAGIIAGTVYQIVQWGYIHFQVGVAQYNAIYGSFAALPLFLLWLQISWLIVLFGAEIAFTLQNRETYGYGPDWLRISFSSRKLLSLLTAHLLIKNFSDGQEPLTAAQISHTLGAPIRLEKHILHELVSSGIIYEMKVEEFKEFVYQPARAINVLTIQYVIDALEQRGVDSITVTQTHELKTLSETLQTLHDAMKKSPANRLLKDI
ncbi:MAG: YihY/virulence factor BrkB family protein [Candidatus Brocadiaceae bacterium]|nr:YihY/virulence factor BrkB family protein [Candidatus Brocadiaceae bacterium]